MGAAPLPFPLSPRSGAMWAAVVSTATAAAALSAPIAVHNMTAPFEPMSLALHGDRLAYGARDCPKNSRSETGILAGPVKK